MQHTDKRTALIARISMLIIFLALLRNLAEPFRIKFYASEPLHINQVEPFIAGALECTIGLFLMVILYLKNKPKIVVSIAILVIITMLITKKTYGV